MSKKIVSGDSAYDTIHEAWVENGRPSQMDRMGAWGGALYHILDASADCPDFYQVASLGPTLFNEDNASERPTQKGWWLINRDYWRQKVRTKHRRAGSTLKIEMIDAPNELEPGETI